MPLDSHGHEVRAGDEVVIRFWVAESKDDHATLMSMDAYGNVVTELVVCCNTKLTELYRRAPANAIRS